MTPLIIILLALLPHPAYPAVSHSTCTDCPGQSSASPTSTWGVGLPSYGGAARHHPITFSDGVRGYLLTGVSGDDFDMYRYDPTQVRRRQHVLSTPPLVIRPDERLPPLLVTRTATHPVMRYI